MSDYLVNTKTMYRTIRKRMTWAVIPIATILVGLRLALFITVQDWKNSCDYFYDPHISQLLAENYRTDVYGLREWVHERYRWVTNDIIAFTKGADISVSWETRFKYYDLYRSAGSRWTASTIFKEPQPRVKSALKCLGEPSYYEAYQESNGVSNNIVFAMWYPSKGIRVSQTFAVYHEPFTLLEDGFTITDEAPLWQMDYAEPGTLYQVAASLYNHDASEPMYKILQPVRPWRGIDKITYYWVDFYDDEYHFWFENPVEKPVPYTWYENFLWEMRVGYLNFLYRYFPPLYELVVR